jgi:hypothetical protein
MKKILIAVSIALAGCATNPLASPTPLAQTTIDEKGLIIAMQTFDTLLSAVDRLVAVGLIKPGSPIALKIADAVHTAKVAFQAASAAQRAGNSTSYFTAISQAQAAIANINQLIKG